MKKILMAAIVMAMGLVMTSCGGAEKAATPEDVVKEAFACIEKQDYAGYLQLIDVKEKDGMTADEVREKSVPMFEAKVKETIDKKGGIKSWEIVETTLSEDGKSAKVKTKIVYGNDTEDDSKMKLVQKEDGKWMIDADK